MSFDPVVFGHRLRHYRRERDMTLEDLGALVDRPAPYLSQVENGKREPRLSQIGALAKALGVTSEELLRPEPPNRRAELELALHRMRQDPRYIALGLAELKPSARVPDEALEHVVTMFEEMHGVEQRPSIDAVRRAAAQVSAWLTGEDGYLDHVERAAEKVLAASGYEGSGALTSRHLNAILAHVGYRVRAVDDIPSQIRSIVDEASGRMFVGQRNSLRTRQARKAILQTVGARVLDHARPVTAFDHQRQRLEEAYFAAAVLVPELPAVTAISTARKARDLSIEDIKERFYVSYEMAAQRFTNLATRHLEIRTHHIRSDPDGIVWKAYQNDGFPIPTLDGAAEGRRLCRQLGGRRVYTSPDRFDIHFQFTDTPAGSFWSATHLTPEQPGHALTTGVRYADARWFRGRRTAHQAESRCPDEACCQAPADLVDVKANHRVQAHLVTVLSGDTPPPPDPADLAAFLARHPEKDETSEADDAAYPEDRAELQEERA